ncbi:hypothetical protein L596_030326 [Steinernema carpocapsae]|uniref:Uncharacterized protein n=1 Tax=Steinernema carpocapsae TaxID=34508 RepID=A0A4U5LP23_STECR|nr:hypothetical protein L596_030326 [Steinernema carpocapsae]
MIHVQHHPLLNVAVPCSTKKAQKRLTAITKRCCPRDPQRKNPCNQSGILLDNNNSLGSCGSVLWRIRVSQKRCVEGSPNEKQTNRLFELVIALWTETRKSSGEHCSDSWEWYKFQ